MTALKLTFCSVDQGVLTVYRNHNTTQFHTCLWCQDMDNAYSGMHCVLQKISRSYFPLHVASLAVCERANG